MHRVPVISRPLILGILNVTPDSFSDGGKYLNLEAALARAEVMAREGADYLDIGGESTRPGAAAVSVDEEMHRVLPVIEAVKKRIDVKISVDTRRFEVAEQAVRAGATLVNDVTGGGDPRLPSLANQTNLSFLLMHMQGTPATMQIEPSYPKGAVAEIKAYLAERVAHFTRSGIPKENIWIDPGFGFGKTLGHNLSLVKHTDEFIGVGGRLAVGLSRKTFLARAAGEPDLAPLGREPGTLATCLWAFHAGASVFRVHEVAPMRRALATWEAIKNAS